MDWNITLPEVPKDDTLVRCSFCGNSQVPGGEAMTSENASICPDCLQLCAHMLEDRAERPAESTKDMVTCSFCGNTRPRVDDAFTAPEGIHICNDCVRKGLEARAGAATSG
jgi:ribosomal protein L24E